MKDANTSGNLEKKIIRQLAQNVNLLIGISLEGAKKMVKKTSLKIDDLVVVMQQCGLTIEKNKDIRLAEFLKVKSWGEVFNRNQMNRKKGYAELLVDEMRKRDER